MKKVSKEELVNLLKNKQNETYIELSKKTGYHPKYLIQLNRKLQKNHYHYVKKKRSKGVSDSIKKQILDDYLEGNDRSYLDFFRRCGKKYSVSYSFLCKFFSNVRLDISLLLIVKVKKYQDSSFLAIDYSTKQVLYKIPSKKNDSLSVKGLLRFILNTYGSPEHISFVHCLRVIPKEIDDLLQFYDICIVPDQTIYHHAFLSSNRKEEFVKYRTCQVNQEHFYNQMVRKTIHDNRIQFCNIRYTILSDKVIPKGKEVILYYDWNQNPIYILYQGVRYSLSVYKKVQSRRGNSKYN